ncbi:MAG TPA: hypothetical protein VGD67_17350 [Pseudonocardiaceae bacterium]
MADLDAEHARPDGATDTEVRTAGLLTEALERMERARGALYEFHQLVGGADEQLDDVLEGLRAAGHDDLADELEQDLVGRNVIAGRWTFQLVEEFDADYHARWLHWDQVVRDRLTGGRRHVFEAELKARRRTPGRPGHEATPR